MTLKETVATLKETGDKLKDLENKFEAKAGIDLPSWAYIGVAIVVVNIVFKFLI